MIRLVVWLLILGAIGYGAARFIPDDTRRAALASIGLDTFFETTAPNFIREKLAIGRDPAAERKARIDELGLHLGDVRQNLDSIASAKTPDEIARHVAEAREELAKAESLATEAGALSSDTGLVKRTTARLIDSVLPAPAAACPAE
ncbi:hypothetical protein C4552_03635 [Candidatus Parcubacteria bacterium]|nr:MAG: hypothetical protein C4552_03635 [Candidatus Parcubacteria bacterium]